MKIPQRNTGNLLVSLLALSFIVVGLVSSSHLLRRAKAQNPGTEATGSTSPSAGLTCVAPPSGMVSWWPGDGDANDIKGANNGTSQSGATFTTGEVGQAFSVNGSSYFAIPDAPSFALTRSLSIDAWVKVTAFPASGHQGKILFRGDDLPSLDPYYLAVTDTGKARFHIENSSGAEVNVEAAISLGQFVHVTGTLDDATGLMTLYLNGTQAAQTTTATRPFGTLSGPAPGVSIGNLQAGSNAHDQGLTGLIDEVELFNRALAQSEIQNIFNAGTAGRCRAGSTFLAAPTYDVVNDFSIQSNPSALNGGVWSYGYSTAITAGSTFNVYDGKTLNTAPLVDRWFASAVNPEIPCVIHNTSDSTQHYASSIQQPVDLLNLHPGIGGQFSIVRWTTPAAGDYQLQGRFEGLDGTTTDVHVIKNLGLVSAQELFTGAINGFGNQAPFSINVNGASAGDTIDFAVGTGNGDFNFDSTGLSASIAKVVASSTPTPTPTPAAVDLSIVNLSSNPAPSALQGQPIAYQIRVVNNGPQLATGVKLTHQLVAYEVYESGGVSNNSGSIGSCSPDSTKVVCTSINLGPGEDATFAVIAHFRKASDPNAGHAAFTASSIQADANVNDNTGQITVSLGTLPRPSNDDIANAVTIINDKGTTTGSNLGGTRQADLNISGVHKAEPNHAGLFGDSSVWYKWTAPSDGPVDFFTTTSKFNTLLGAYTLDNGYFNTVASNDDAAPDVTWSKVHFDAVANKTYYIAVDGFLGAAGDLSLGWSHLPVQAGPAPATITAICSGDKPNCDPQHNPADYAAVCTSDSDPTLLCQQFVDAGGFTVITVKGTNFTTNSQVIMRGDVLKGFDNHGNPINGSTTFVNSTTLTAHIPPNPPLKIADLATMQVLTFLSSATAAAAREAVTIESIPAGTSSLAANVALLNVIELKTATIPVGHSQTVCGNVPGLNKFGEETCIFLTNLTDAPSRTVSPTWFRIVAYCNALKLTNEQCYKYGDGQAGLNQLMSAAFAINPREPITGGTITVHQQFPIPTDADLNRLGALVIAQGGGNVIAQGGGNVIAAGGGNVIAQGGGNVIAQGGGNVIAQGGGNVIAQGGGNVIAQGGGNVIAQGGGNAARPDDVFHQPDTAAPPMLSSADLQNGSKGWFVASSSSGNAPTVEVTTNLDGTMTGTLTITFDQTSSPRVQDLQGLVFTVVSNPAVVRLASNNITVNEGDGRAVVTLSRTGDTSTTVTVSYATSPGTATEKTDYMPVYGAVTFNPGETQKTVNIPLIDNGYGPGSGAQRSLNLTIGNAVGGAIQMPNLATITINNNDTADLTTNQADDSRFFVRQHYLDFLGREPDQAGWDFWTNNIESCGADANCRQVKRIDTSAAFFLSIEFQNTGFLVHRLYNAALNRLNQMPRYVEFIRDTQQMGNGLVVGRSGWEQQLEANKQAFLDDFVTRSEFCNLYPDTMSAADYVDALYSHAGVTPSAAERQVAIDEFNNADGHARGRVLRRVAESTALTTRETTRAFVLAEYFGYLRRGPDDAPDGNLDGFNFWLTKLNDFGGDYRRSEMVKAFITSSEYRRRFGPN